MNPLQHLYRWAFARPAFARFNRSLMVLGLNGLGVLNYSSARASGELAFLRRELAGLPAPLVLDIGANRGLYAEMVLGCAPGARLHAFEPHPRTFEALTQRFGGRAGVVLNHAGCGAAAGELSLFDYAEADGSSHASMHREVIERLHASRAVEHRVPVTTVDDYVARRGLERIDLLKIDTEGHEFAVLQGAARTLDQGRVERVHLEFNEMNAMSGVFFRQIHDLLAPHYRLYRLLPSAMLEITRYTPLDCEIFAFQNIVALRRR